MTRLYKQNPRVATRTFRGEAAFITPEDRRINILNQTATAIWQLCQERPMSIDDVCAEMMDRFTGEPETIRRDIGELLDGLVEMGALICRSVEAD